MSDFALYPRDTCATGNDFNGREWGARISSVFVVFFASTFGAFFPILSSRYSFIRLPSWCFFIAKYFGSGVIVATAFIHLLQPANEALSDPCLGGTFGEYPWAFGICLMTLMFFFFVELCAFHTIDRKLAGQESAEHTEEPHSHSHFGDTDLYVKNDKPEVKSNSEQVVALDDIKENIEEKTESQTDNNSDMKDIENNSPKLTRKEKEDFYGKLLAVFVLEFGVIFHSVFVGLSLAVSGEEFKSLYIVVVFHQLFEGLGLGTRIALAPWPKSKRATPWILAVGYSLCTPIAIGIGLGVRQSYPPNSRRSLITNGCFDSISAGVLFYTGLIELMAHEFLYSGEFKGPNGFKRCISAYIVMCFGAGLMALLGKWA